MVERLLEAAVQRARPLPATPKAIIAPHAGYIYSGGLAAAAYAGVARNRGQIRRVVLLGPVHRVPVRGLALPGASHMASPLGTVAIDPLAVASLAALPQVVTSAAAHAQEHSLEVHLPFLQTLLDDFTLVPLAVGDATPDEVAEVLDKLWGGTETLIVVSSDLSHFHHYDEARSLDGDTVQKLLQGQLLTSHQQACGATPINGLLVAAKRHGLVPHLVGLGNSGDTAGDKSRVVGYLSMAFLAGTQVASGEAGRTLLAHARDAIARHLGISPADPPLPAWLQHRGATFVTLTKNGRLRGCIGTLQAYRSLLDDVRANAVAAAVRDSRFPPLSADELALVRVEVSLLNSPEPMQFADEHDLLRQLRPGVDGLILECGGHRGTFLPQVWEQLPEKPVFWAHLKQKAGLPPDFWSPDIRVWRYTVNKWQES